MKIYKIVLFIFIAILLLGVGCYFFPQDGIDIGEFHLRFPTLEKVLTRNSANAPTEQEIQDSIATMEALIAQREKEMKDREDSLNLYKEVINTHISRIYLPDDDYSYFNTFFEKAAKAKSQGKTVRVVHYGDSQIELDRISSNLRSFFQSKFGGSGPGLLPIVQTVPTSTVSQWATESFTAYTSYGIGNRDDNGYGIMGKYYRVYGGGTCGFSRTRASHVRLLFNDRNGAFSATLTDKNSEYADTLQADSTTGFKILEWYLPATTSAFNLHFSGTADLYGVMVDNGSGVAVDNVPMRGCAGTIFTKMGTSLLQQSYRRTNVGMLVLQYGGNAMPGIASKSGVDYYAKEVGRQIRYLKSIYPDTPILFIGPADMATKVDGELRSYPLISYMVEALKREALANGAAFWNIYEVMGGDGSIIRWTNQGLAGADYVHFSPAGATKIGNYLVDAFATIYDYYTVDKQTATPE